MFNRDDVATKPDGVDLDAESGVVSFGSDDPASQQSWGLRGHATNQKL